MCKFREHEQFMQKFWQIIRNSAKTIRFHRISAIEKWVKLRYFTQYKQWFWNHTSCNSAAINAEHAKWASLL